MATREIDLSRSFTESVASADERYNDFLADLRQVVKPYLPENEEWTEEVILNTVRSLSMSPKAPESSKIREALQDWDKWARELFMSASDGTVASASRKELRFILSEMIMASISHRRLIDRLDSLRTQKRFLEHQAKPVKRLKEPTLSSMIVFAVGMMRVMRKSGHLLIPWTQGVEPETGTIL